MARHRVRRRRTDRAASCWPRSTPSAPPSASPPRSASPARPRDGNDAEALLGAADVALRIAKRTGKHRASLYAGDPLVRGGSGGAREVLDRIVEGEGLWMAVQPIVNTLGGSVHCYEALARFEGGQGPLHWFELAEELGMRRELEIACLRKTLDLLDELPTGTQADRQPLGADAVRRRSSPS